MEDFIEEADGAKILGRHDILVVDFEFEVALFVADDIAATAELETGAPIGRVVVVVEREVAFAADAHAEGAVGEDLYLYQLALGPSDVVVANELGNLRHLPQRQFAGSDNHIGEASIVAHSLDVRDVALGGDMHFDANLISIGDDGHIGGDDGADTSLAGGMEKVMHLGDLIVVDDSVDGEVGANTSGIGYGADTGQVGDGRA